MGRVYCQQSALGHGVRVRMGRRYVVFNVNTNGARRRVAVGIRYLVSEGIGAQNGVRASGRGTRHRTGQRVGVMSRGRIQRQGAVAARATGGQSIRHRYIGVACYGDYTVVDGAAVTVMAAGRQTRFINQCACVFRNQAAVGQADL